MLPLQMKGNTMNAIEEKMFSNYINKVKWEITQLKDEREELYRKLSELKSNGKRIKGRIQYIGMQIEANRRVLFLLSLYIDGKLSIEE